MINARLCKLYFLFWKIALRVLMYYSQKRLRCVSISFWCSLCLHMRRFKRAFLKKANHIWTEKNHLWKNVQFICDAIVFSHVRTFCSHVKIENSMWKKPENVMCFHVPCFVENCKHQAQNHIWMSVDHMLGFQLTCENSWSHENSMINSSPRFPLSFMCLYGYFWIYKANQASWLRIICSPSHFQHKRKPDSRYSLS